MAITNIERVGKALESLKEGLTPFVERELKAQDAQGWLSIARQSVAETQVRLFVDGRSPQWDAASLLAVIWNQWNSIFRKTFGQSERTLVSELRDVRNRWAHQNPFSSDDTDRALDSVERLLTAVSAPQAEEVRRSKMELRRTVYDEQARSEKRKSAGTAVEGLVSAGLKPWRDVVTPHKDVASGRYQQAEFAADLWQVHVGEGGPEYRDPAEFFRRTHLTESLKRLLAGAVERISGKGGDPVIQLQTNFGGGKTHSMLALYHLLSGAKPRDLAGVDAILAEIGIKDVPKAKRVVLVGNKISPGNPVTKDDGTVVRTLWGELAWQLGGKRAFARVAADDERATSPGDILRELFNDFGPCLVLVDEWVAYARQLHDQSDLPGGSFETQFSFAQVLTESARAAKNCLLVVSLPASDTHGSPHTQADDVEVGGIRGREALDRLRNVIGRLESSWRPATAEEGFEIVRRRLFEPMDEAKFKLRDVTAQAFSELYRTQSQEFPLECRNREYETRIKAAFPIHPEIFDRLYTDWSTLVKFQRTRGVLRLMAAVIHSLWMKDDKNPLIMPSTIPIDDPRVQNELTRYLSDNWVPVIEKDVDGPNSTPLRLDAEIPNLGKLHAARRVARTIYLGSAPTAGAAHRGIEDRQVKLGCVMPGESPAIFGDALRHLARTETYLYNDGPRYWYSLQPTVQKLAEDRAELLKRDLDKVAMEIESRVRLDLRRAGDFRRVHPLPKGSADVPDDMETRLVVLGIEHPCTKESGSPAEAQAKAILETRGNSPRLYRNTLVFLAPDKARLQDLDEAVRRFLAWDSIVEERVTLNLDPQQAKQAENQRASADSTVTARLPETYQWLLVPEQRDAKSEVEWRAVRLTGSDSLAVRASKKLKNEETLIGELGGTILRKHLDDVPLWRGDHVSLRQLVEDFAKYPYLPRVAGPDVVVGAARSGINLISWEQETFAYAEGYDESADRYRGLRAAAEVPISGENSPGLLVKPGVAIEQIRTETPTEASTQYQPAFPPSAQANGGLPPETVMAPRRLVRFHGSISLDPDRLGRDAGRIAEEIVQHLALLRGAEVDVTLEIQAKVPGGTPENVVRIVTENCRTLKFDSSGFEEE